MCEDRVPTLAESEATVWEAGALVARSVIENDLHHDDYAYFVRLHYPECDPSFVVKVGETVSVLLGDPFWTLLNTRRGYRHADHSN